MNQRLLFFISFSSSHCFFGSTSFRHHVHHCEFQLPLIDALTIYLFLNLFVVANFYCLTLLSFSMFIAFIRICRFCWVFFSSSLRSTSGCRCRSLCYRKTVYEQHRVKDHFISLSQLSKHLSSVIEFLECH